ncbi:MAG: hypothetical protein IEMM0008_0790 [bacterium]|nr:MAG: hypothetical protein IEMM0008_0790 [bacterium]
MGLKIEQDYNRFKDIVKGKIRKELKEYISRSEMFGKQGKDIISIPVPQIDLPHFKFNHNEQSGVGQGEGEVGDVIGQGDGQGEGAGKAGDSPGDHILEVEISLNELAEMLGEELQLPKIEPKGRKNITNLKDRYTSIRNVGPESLRNFKRTFQQALKRQIASGTYNKDNPIVIPERRDKRYKSWKTVAKPEASAVIIYMMDVSGSMTEHQKEIVRIESFWIDTWLRSQYKEIASRYIIHDAEAREVDRETFYHTRESGGTRISSAYQVCLNIINEHYPFEEWNIYPFHFSDGDNWSRDDDQNCIRLLEDELLKRCNMFCYGQVEGIYGVGNFKQVLDESFSIEQNLITSEIEDKEGIYESIKDFLGKGK